MTKWGYILENILWAILGTHWYKQICFANFLELDDEFSKLVLYFLVGTFVLIGIILTLKHRRNSVNTFVNIAFPIKSRARTSKSAKVWFVILTFPVFP